MPQANSHPPPTANLDAAKLTAGARVVAFWNLGSRLTGFLRAAVIAAILGPTFFGNLFQTVLYVPFVISELIAVSLIPLLLTPRLVRLIEGNEPEAAQRLAKGFLGIAFLLFAGIALIAAVAAPTLLHVLTAAVSDPVVRDRQIALGLPLLLALLPQIVLYAVIWTAVAVQHAHSRFALSTAAQMVENIGLVGVLIASALIFGVGSEVDGISSAHILLLGIGSTGVVAVHAAVQWWGAARVGFRLFPTAGWRDSRVREVLRRMPAAGGAAALNSVAWLSVLVASGHIPGGAVAFQMAYSMFNLPVSLLARPLAVAQLPLLSRGTRNEPHPSFHMSFHRSLRLALFVTLPACAAFLAMPDVLAGAVAFGEMATPAAMSMISAILLGLGIGLVGEAVLVVSSSAAYALLNAGVQLRAAVIRAVAIAVGIMISFVAPAEAQPLLLGLSFSLGAVLAGAYLRLQLRYPTAGDLRPGWAKWSSINAAMAITAIIPAAILAPHVSSSAASAPDRVLTALALIALSAIIYLGGQRIAASEELKALLAVRLGRRHRHVSAFEKRGGR